MEEFGRLDYGEATIDGICAGYGISKGMMYYYWPGKQPLFLACAGQVLDGLWEYVGERLGELERLPVQEALRGFFALRERYFEGKKEQRRVFERILLRPPVELKEEIRLLREPMRRLNREFMQSIVSRARLRDGISLERAMWYLDEIEPMVWLHLPGKGEGDTLSGCIEESEALMDMLLFGIIEKGEGR